MKLSDPPFSHCAEILDYVRILEKEGKTVNLPDIEEFFSKTASYTKKALQFLLDFSFLNYTSSGYTIDSSITSQLTGNKNDTLLLFKSRLAKFKPFMEYYYFKGHGKSTSDSAKLVKKIYSIDQSIDVIIKTFDSWEKTFKLSPSSVSRTDEKTLDVLSAQQVDNEVQALKYLKDRLGNNYKDISERILTDFSKALSNVSSDPGGAITDMGRGLEDVIRLQIANTIDLSKCSGLGQIGNELNKFSVTHKKHNSILLALASIRSMGDAHGADKTNGERWVVQERSARLFIEEVLTLINSLFAYKNEGKLLF